MHLVQAVGVTTWEWMFVNSIPLVDESWVVFFFDKMLGRLKMWGGHVWDTATEKGGECIFEKMVQLFGGYRI